MCNYLQNTLPMKIKKIHVIEEGLRLEETISKESDEKFLWTDYPGVEARVRITLEGGAAGMVYAALCLSPADPEDPSPPAILPIPTVSYLLRDRENGSGESQNVLRSTYAQFGCGSFSYGMDFECQLCPKSWLLLPVYSMNDAVELQVFVETNAAARRIHSNDGTLQWTIESWPRKRKSLLDGFADSFRSHYFYAEGYRVQAWISIATGEMRAGAVADGEEKDVLVDIVFLSGVNDDEGLSKLFPHSTTVTLKNLKHPDESVVSQSVKWKWPRRYQLMFPGEKVRFDSLLLEVVIKAKVTLKKS